MIKHSKTLIRYNLGMYEKVRKRFNLTLDDLHKYIYFVETPSENKLIIPEDKHHKQYIFIKDGKYKIQCIDTSLTPKWGGV